MPKSKLNAICSPKSRWQDLMHLDVGRTAVHAAWRRQFTRHDIGGGTQSLEKSYDLNGVGGTWRSYTYF